MAKPKSKPQLSLQSAHIADDAAGIPDDHWCRLFFRYIYCALDESMFADMYQDGGRAPISPVLLTAITILQYLFQVGDRLAVEATIMRRDWRIALARIIHDVSGNRSQAPESVSFLGVVSLDSVS